MKTIYLGAVVSFGLQAQASSIIGTNLRNGGFEANTLQPWQQFGTSGISIGQDADFAFQGTHFAILSETPGGSVARTTALQSFTLDSSFGSNFTLSFWIRGSEGPFLDFVSVTLHDSTNITATVTPILTPSVSPLEWREFSYLISLPESWDTFSDSDLRIQLQNHNASAATTYTSYLDEVNLQSVPEPSTVYFILISLSTIGFVIRFKTKKG